MTEWAYLWRETYWAESSRTKDYIEWIRYQHVWMPDLKTEVPFPDQDGLDSLGKAGWELVTMTSDSVSLATRISPQQGESYSAHRTYLLMFKRPLLHGVGSLPAGDL